MNKELSKSLSERLWKYFTPIIESGSQLYFCFNREVIRTLFADCFAEDPLEGFFKHVSAFFEVSGERCRIKAEAFMKNDAFSLVILLVAQQVLVVEDMVNENGITEDAYFPRLRRRISPSLSEISLHPVVLEDFMKV
ncbi:MAG: hypothetical protein IPK68_22595 [Bdellovibrionales bacterium]|nr:hypothetical protein [Bdellovibrionales bacterium]